MGAGRAIYQKRVSEVEMSAMDSCYAIAISTKGKPSRQQYLFRSAIHTNE